MTTQTYLEACGAGIGVLPASSGAPGGRGLRFVDSVATRRGARDGSSQIWCELLTSRPSGADRGAGDAE